MSFVKAMEAAATSAEVVANFIGSVDEHLRIKEWIRLVCSGNHLQLKWTPFLRTVR